MNDSLIKQLPSHLSNQIAAGEVVQRPESVVKELIENAIDAGADHVSIVIEQGGKSLIQVIDNGSGMSEEDLPIAFERHATSKIFTYEDLENIVTFGFRGEALPSIASVSQVEIRSRREEDEIATFIRIDGGTIQELTKTQGEVGTSIAIKNIFFNTPARRQFMKSNATEFRHITDTVHRFILSYPNVRWTFISENEKIYEMQPGTLKDRLAVIFGDRAAASMIEIHETSDVCSVTGFIGRPNFAKKSRGNQFLFLNTRYIINRLINHAVVSAYEQMIDSSEYPPYVIFLNINPREVDVNVHPSKLEVKFSNERHIYSLVNAVVRRGLYEHDLSPSMTFRDKTGESDIDKVRLISPDEQRRIELPHTRQQPFSKNFSDKEKSEGGRRGQESFTHRGIENVDELFRSLGMTKEISKDSERVEADTQERISAIESERTVYDTLFLWQLHDKYIFSPIKSGLMIIDQHVAHERILYERALATMKNALPFAQQLLFPHTMRLTPGNFALIQELEPELKRLGFVLHLSPPNFVTVEAVPQDVKVGMEERILEELLEQFKEYSELGTTEVRDNIAKSFSCKAAIKAGDKLNSAEMQRLIDELFATEVPYVCPHGRPIIIKLSLEDIDRKFGRTS